MHRRHIYKLKDSEDYFKVCSCGRRRKAVPKVKKSKFKKQNDILWSKITKEIHIANHGRICLWCKKPSDNLQSDHIMNRWKQTTRWNPENCVVLCAPCHLFRKKREPLEWARMVMEEIGEEKYADLRLAADTIVPIDPEDIHTNLLLIQLDKPWLK